MGTPHGGSDVASWTTLGARLLNALSLGTRTNKELLECLRKDSPLLTLLSQKFTAQSQSLRILSFYETEKFPMMSCRVSELVASLSPQIKVQSGMCALTAAKIVDKESAHLRLPNETFLPIPADHRAMCRFSDDRSQKFQAVKDAIVCLARGDERTFMDPRPSSGEISLSL